MNKCSLVIQPHWAFQGLHRGKLCIARLTAEAQWYGHALTGDTVQFYSSRSDTILNTGEHFTPSPSQRGSTGLGQHRHSQPRPLHPWSTSRKLFDRSRALRLGCGQVCCELGPLLRRLPQNLQAYTYDRSGHNLDRSPNPPTAESVAEEVDMVLKKDQSRIV